MNITSRRGASRLCDNGGMASARSTRTLRGVVAAAFSTFVALFSHIVGGGMMPGVLGIVVPLVFSVFISVLLAGRRLSLFRLTLSVAASQYLFHTLFVLGTAQGVASSSAVGGHAVHGAPVVIDAAALPMSHGVLAGPEMWFAHGIAAVVTIATLHWAEALISTVSAVKEFVLRSWIPSFPIALALPMNPARLLGYGQILPVRPLGVFPTTVVLRGPPVLRVV